MKSNTKQTLKTFMMLIIFGTLFTACSKDDDTKVSVKLTDDPFPLHLVREAKIGVAKVELVDNNGNTVTVFSGNTKVNMVNYMNGATAEVAVNTVPAGTYVKARVTLNEASITLNDNNHFNANVSTSHSYEVNINPAVEVSEGEEEDLLLDLDLSDSFRFSGTPMGHWFTQITGIQAFNPDFRAVCLSKTGKIEGEITDANGNPVAHAYVAVAYDYNGDGQADTVSTIADANGHYAIIGLPAGTYQVEVDAENGDGESANVTVTTRHGTTVNVTIN